ncbi:MAG: acetyl-CoA decarbonylase/synthase complex subunit delta [Candidatus Omnitrophica bacterium CG1_02_44_16]|nr:MAG: acetyl-CoA decarbonylase/synthase complex subunit delta [Candidatus Omnitrophica bacterium CG1_02_44_16]PIY82121.1 MAG: acetyl-CoA decarbonylase/synthase complex subunit delta [Candidatus Omnitrophica bacterium CG_4_10_14_0_8_um_filter_44_12]PIZ85024.1 MAG: acetyl-CoA decarbonylase/synthase complex subunit delta [Candidatus Omnitrophica bacterium CG_4_10_14_0_2_um_filter_44_9]
MADELKLLEKWSLKVHEVKLGAGPSAGGSREIIFNIGGQSSFPFLFKEGDIPNRPLIAAEVLDCVEDDWPVGLRTDLASVSKDPVEWARKMASDSGADLVCLKLQGLHPDLGNKPVKDAMALVEAVLKNIKTPLIILGCGSADKDNEVLPAISEATKGERLLFGDVVSENYKTLAAACIADGHNIIAESPIDVNIAKQLNILLSDIGMPLDRIVINPTIGALGYGLEYAYSIMERAKSAALAGDKMLAMPFICFVGQESWRAKEAKVSLNDFPQGGNARMRGIMWEVVTAMAMVEAGADILTMRHPEAIKIVKSAITDLMKR